MVEPSRDIPRGWPKEVKKMAEVLRDQGWRFDTTKRGHPRLWPPKESGHHAETYSGTPGDWRGIRNLRKALERKGARFPKGTKGER